MQDYIVVLSAYRKVSVPVAHIVYITTQNRKTVITLDDGSSIKTNRSLRDIMAELPDSFENINRGIVVSASFIATDRDGIITMKDGATFHRRLRADHAPKNQGAAPSPNNTAHSVTASCPAETLSSWLGSMPLPFCIMELRSQSRGVGAEFVLRFCNRELEFIEGKPASEMLDLSTEVMPVMGNPKWAPIFADVALNGVNRVIEDAIMSSDRYYQIQAFQPVPGYCACIILDLTKENNLVRTLFRRSSI